MLNYSVCVYVVSAFVQRNALFTQKSKRENMIRKGLRKKSRENRKEPTKGEVKIIKLTLMMKEFRQNLKCGKKRKHKTISSCHIWMFQNQG
jgi:hypothetical protein